MPSRLNLRLMCSLPVSQMFIVDSTSLREKCGKWVASRCKMDEYEYAAIESELKDDPSWPPVSSKTIDLATAFQRLDSVHQIPPDQRKTNGVSSCWYCRYVAQDWRQMGLSV